MIRIIIKLYFNVYSKLTIKSYLNNSFSINFSLLNP